MNDNYGGRLFPQHAAMLAASGITPERARARGYVSVDTKVRLDRLGIAKAGQRVPGLLIPSLRKDGSVWGYQYRPDDPRQRDGKPVKYETPVGQRNGIDVPPGVRDILGDPTVPLVVTEGVKKADSATEAGLPTVALPGVWSWRGRNDHDGLTAVGDWEDVALNGRRVILAFDSDVVRKRPVRKALDRLAAYLTSKGATVEYLHLPDDPSGKTGLDDFLVAGHGRDDVLALVRPDPPEVVDEPDPPAGLAGVAGVAGHFGGSAAGSSDPSNEVCRYEKAELEATPDLVRSWLGRFIATMDESDLDLLTLWAIHTWLVQETYTTPRLILDSPTWGSGKTTVLEHFERLCLHPVQMASVASPALLTRMLDAGMRTILIDEADKALRPEKEGVGDIIAVLNSGYKRGATRPVLVPGPNGEWIAKEMPTFAPVVMAGTNPNLPDDTRSRSIRVLLMPDVEGLTDETDWEVLDAEATELGRRLAAWADSVRDFVRDHRPQMPEGIRGRARERWGPMKRVADAIGGRWPAVVDRLAVEDMERLKVEMEDGLVQQRPAVVLLRHIHEVWAGETFLATDELVDRLVFHDPDMWGEGSRFGRRLTPQRLGRMLVSSYNIHSMRWVEPGRPRGYTFATFLPAFRRLSLVPPSPPTRPATPATPAKPAERQCVDCGQAIEPDLLAAAPRRVRCRTCADTAADGGAA